MPGGACPLPRTFVLTVANIYAEPPSMTPLAPSVEKAYYRKCIQLKRRLNEVEAANDEAKVRRVRLDRAIMKMRLERAFLLDELRKRMEHNVDGSEGSGDDGLATPPPDRPYRDKRRRQQSATHGSTAPPANTFHSGGGDGGSAPLHPGSNGQMVASNAVNDDGRYTWVEPSGATAPSTAPGLAPALPHGSPYAPPPTGMPSGVNGTNGENERDGRTINRAAGTTGEPTGVGPTSVEENGVRKVTSSAESANAESQSGRGAFTAVNT